MSIVIPSLRAAIAVPRWVTNELWRKARAMPSLDLRFADNKSLADAVTGASLVTFTRASSGTFVDSAGVIQTASTNVPRFDHNPITGESLGLLVEAQRTNSIRNNTMVGAVAGTPGTLPTNWAVTNAAGLTRTVVGTGVVNGINYIDVRFDGTSTGSIAVLALDTATAIAASNSQAWAMGLWMSIVGGSATNISSLSLTINQFSSIAFLSSLTGPNIVSTISSSLVRQVFDSTTNNAAIATVQPVIVLSYASGVAIDITLRIGLPQLEQGAFATSPILTSTAAVTRNADVASITGSAFSGWYRQDEGTVFTSAIGVNNISAATRRFAEIMDGTNNERMILGYSATSNTRFLVIDNGAVQSDRTVTEINAGILVKMSAAYKTNDFQQASNGTLSTAGASGTLPIVNQMLIGDAGSSETTLNGTIKRLTFWPQRLPNNILQGITQ
jgi:hypothetical protein